MASLMTNSRTRKGLPGGGPHAAPQESIYKLVGADACIPRSISPEKVLRCRARAAGYRSTARDGVNEEASGSALVACSTTGHERKGPCPRHATLLPVESATEVVFSPATPLTPPSPASNIVVAPRCDRLTKVASKHRSRASPRARLGARPSSAPHSGTTATARRWRT